MLESDAALDPGTWKSWAPLLTSLVASGFCIHSVEQPVGGSNKVVSGGNNLESVGNHSFQRVPFVMSVVLKMTFMFSTGNKAL